MQKRVLFLTLNIFSATGGIEKVSRIAGKALYELGLENGYPLQVFSMYDCQEEVIETYFPATAFRGFGGHRTAFVLRSIAAGYNAGVVILSHINLLSVGYAIKRFSPKTKIIMLAHGIEVWEPLSALKRHLLHTLDAVLPVSAFTKQKMQELHGLPGNKLQVVNNCIDPLLAVPVKGKSGLLLEKYGLTATHTVLLTLTRLSSRDWYKGYDEVLMAVKALKKEHPGLRYLLIGKYDDPEKARLDRLIRQQGLTESVIFTGYVPDSELAAHFSLADIYIMPSRKEGFGIVFIEAMYYGLPVIAGSVDGSVDALANGSLGTLVNPDSPVQIREALRPLLQQENRKKPSREAVLQRFGFPVYKKKLGEAIGFFPKSKKGVQALPARKEKIKRPANKPSNTHPLH